MKRDGSDVPGRTQGTGTRSGHDPVTLDRPPVLLRLPTSDEIDENLMLGVKVDQAEPPPPKFPGNDDLSLLLKACAGRGIWERRDTVMIRLGEVDGRVVTVGRFGRVVADARRATGGAA